MQKFKQCYGVNLSDKRKWIETQAFVVVGVSLTKMLGINMFSRVFVSKL